MRHHSIVVRLGSADTQPIVPSRTRSQVDDVQFIGADAHLLYGLGKVIDDLGTLGLAPSEIAVDLALLATSVTAADTRISRRVDAQDRWTREIDLHVPVSDPNRWSNLAPLVVTTLRFLTGDHWSVFFRGRDRDMDHLVHIPRESRLPRPTSVCLFSGGLDSFIGAVDLCAAGERPFLVSHWWDAITSKHQSHCIVALRRRFPTVELHHLRAHVGFPQRTLGAGGAENTLRGRSFLFFALAALVADAVGGDAVIHVPENGLISLNVPLDRHRIGSNSTRTTHPFYMARFNEILRGLGLRARLNNRYAFATKGQMATGCADQAFLREHAANTMSCSSPATRRFDSDPAQRKPKHCGYCVPCLIRRAAIRESWPVDDTAYRVDLHARVLDTRKPEGEHVRSFQLALSKLVRAPGRAKYDVHRPGPLSDHPEDLAKYEAVYVAGLQEVGRLLEGVMARPL